MLIQGIDATYKGTTSQDSSGGNLEERGFFSSVVKFFGGGCSLQVAGYIADSATSAALGLATAETGIGLAVGIGNAAINYGLAIQTAMNC